MKYLSVILNGWITKAENKKTETIKPLENEEIFDHLFLDNDTDPGSHYKIYKYRPLHKCA